MAHVPMSGEEMRDCLAALDLPTRAFAHMIARDDRTVRRMVAGRDPVPPLIADFLRLGRQIIGARATTGARRKALDPTDLE